VFKIVLDPDPGRPHFSQKNKKLRNFMLEEFLVGLEASREA
jgi:hypothetical protein